MPRGVKGALALPKSKGSITSFFNGTSKALRRVVECPICSIKVEEGQINKHMDGPDCKLEGSEISIIEVEDKEKKNIDPAALQPKVVQDLEENEEQYASAGKLVKTKGPFPKLVGKRPSGPDLELNKPKRQKTLTKDVISRNTERSTVHPVAGNEEALEQNVKDESIISDLLEDKDWVDEDSSQQKILLSPSISYNPARYILLNDHFWSLEK